MLTLAISYAILLAIVLIPCLVIYDLKSDLAQLRAVTSVSAGVQ